MLLYGKMSCFVYGNVTGKRFGPEQNQHRTTAASVMWNLRIIVDLTEEKVLHRVPSLCFFAQRDQFLQYSHYIRTKPDLDSTLVTQATDFFKVRIVPSNPLTEVGVFDSRGPGCFSIKAKPPDDHTFCCFVVFFLIGRVSGLEATYFLMGKSSGSRCEKLIMSKFGAHHKHKPIKVVLFNSSCN